MGWKLFVDDDRVGPQSSKWGFAANYETATEMIQARGVPFEISLDHDIWTGLIQGTEFCEWLVKQTLPADFSYYIHSSNEDGASKMEEILFKATGKRPKNGRTDYAARIWWADKNLW